MKIRSTRIEITFSKSAKILKLALPTIALDLTKKTNSYSLHSEKAMVSKVKQIEGGMSASLETSKTHGHLVVKGGEEISVGIEPEEEQEVKKVGLKFFLPEEAQIHLPENYNIGRIIDKDMPIGKKYTSARIPLLSYQFIAIKLRESWLRLSFPLKFRSHVNSLALDQIYPEFEIHRVKDGFYLQCEWPSEISLCLQGFDSLDKLASNYDLWLKKEFGLVELKDNPHIPSWVANTKFIITLDMYRSNGDIAHSYQQAASLFKELFSIGCPEDTLFYIPGWNYKYDAHYPEYSPAPELGGSKKFKEMVVTAHKCGYRIMIHTNPWGADPYLPGFEKIEKLTLKGNTFNDYAGWPGGWRERKLKFDTGQIKISATMEENIAIFHTIFLSNKCEARLTLGGMKSEEDVQVAVRVNNRSLTVPKSWFKKNTSYTFPFPFLFRQGENRIEVQFINGTSILPDNAWYRIHNASQFSPIWTYPIVAMNMSNKEWVALFTQKVSQVVKEYEIDAVHLDAIIMWEMSEIYSRLRDLMPGVAFSSEYGSESGMNYFAFAQNARLYLEDSPSWQSKYTDLPYMITQNYTRFYQHLCESEGFVPVRKVCNIEPLPKRVDESKIRRIIDRTKRFHVIKSIRVNYKDYALDPNSRAFLMRKK